MKFSEKKYRQKLLLDQKSNSLILLIGICLISFVLLAFVKALWYFNYPDKQVAQTLFQRNVLGLFTLPANPGKFLQQPWSILSSIFITENNYIWKVFPNMFWLWAFGYILQDLTGARKIIPLFIYGAFGGALSFMLAYNFLPALEQQRAFASFSGVASGVMTVAIVTTLVSPGYRIFPMIGGGIPLWALTFIYLIADFATISISDTGTMLTHLGAAITGFLFIFFLRKGYDWSEWMNRVFDWFNDLFNPDKPRKSKSIREELFYQSSSTPYIKIPRVTQERIDEILDKINQQGYKTLSEEEKELLKRASREDI
jgi:membrane associated rhomboid family serine protease